MSDWRDNPRPVPGVTRAKPVETSGEYAVCMGCSRRHEGAIAACPHCEKRPGARGSRFCDACCGAFVCARCGNDHGLCYECHVAVHGDALREHKRRSELDSRLGDALRASGINAADALAVQALYATAGQSGSHRIVSALRAVEAWLREDGAL